MINIITGPMFAGKTTELLRRIERAGHAGMRTVLIGHVCDTRYSMAEVVSHGGLHVPCIKLDNLRDLKDASDYDVIGVDEGQFFDDLVSTVDKWADEGRTVVVAALDGDSNGAPFGHVAELLCRAEGVDKLTAVCRVCRGNAAFTVATIEGATGVGGAEKYKPVCRKCRRENRGRCKS